MFEKLKLKRESIYIIGKIYPIYLDGENKYFHKNKESFINRVNEMLFKLGINFFDDLTIHCKNLKNIKKEITDRDSINTFSVMIDLKKKN